MGGQPSKYAEGAPSVNKGNYYGYTTYEFQGSLGGYTKAWRNANPGKSEADYNRMEAESTANARNALKQYKKARANQLGPPKKPSPPKALDTMTAAEVNSYKEQFDDYARQMVDYQDSLSGNSESLYAVAKPDSYPADLRKEYDEIGKQHKAAEKRDKQKAAEEKLASYDRIDTGNSGANNKLKKGIADAKKEIEDTYNADKAAYAAAIQEQRSTALEDIASQRAAIIEEKEGEKSAAKQERDARLKAESDKLKAENDKQIKDYEDAVNKNIGDKKKTFEDLNAEEKKKEQERDKMLNDMYFENQHRGEINKELNKLRLGENACDSNYPDELEELQRQEIEDDIEDEMELQDEMEGGNLQRQLYLLNRRFIKHNSDERRLPVMSNASKKNKKYKYKKSEKVDRKVGGRVGATSTGLAGLAVQAAELLHEVAGPEIKAAFQRLGDDIRNWGNQLADSWWCNTHVRECRDRNRERRYAEQALARDRAYQQANEAIANYKIDTIAKYQEKLEDDQEKMDEAWEKEYAKMYEDWYAEYERIVADADKKYEEEEAADNKKFEDDQAAREKFLEDEQNRLDKKQEDDIKDLENKQTTYVETEKKRKEDFDKAVVKNVETRMANKDRDEAATKGMTNCGATVQSAEKMKHDAIQEEKAKREKEEQDKAKNVTPDNPNGSGRKNKRNDIVKAIMKKKGLSMIEASKYVKSHNLY